MRKKIFICLFFILLFIIPISVSASSSNSDYKIIIEDDADLLSNGDEIELKSIMQPLTEYGNVLFKTTNLYNKSSSESYIRSYYYTVLGNQKGVAFYIDMNQRQVCACASGGLDKIITSGKCDSIMDNVYLYARSGNYYKCASETYSQMYRLLSGGKIAESMKYICNAILSIMISLFTSYSLFMIFSGNKKASQKELIEECTINFEHSPINVVRTGSHREYSPRSDSSSSGGGHSGGGGRRRIFWQ